MSSSDPFHLSAWGPPEYFEQKFWTIFEAKFRPWWDQPVPSDIEKYGTLFDDAKGCTEIVGEDFDEFGQFLELRCNLPYGSIHSHRRRQGTSNNPYRERKLDYTLRLHPPTLLNSLLLPDGIVVAGESEWGTWGKLRSNSDKVRVDFLKLIDVTAPIKILIYGCHAPPNDHRSDTSDLLDMFRSDLIRDGRYVSGEVWLFIGISWGPGPWNPHVNVVGRESGQLLIAQPEWFRTRMISTPVR